MERVEGIEPSWPAWKAGTLPLSYTRKEECNIAKVGKFVNGFLTICDWKMLNFLPRRSWVPENLPDGGQEVLTDAPIYGERSPTHAEKRKSGDENHSGQFDALKVGHDLDKKDGAAHEDHHGKSSHPGQASKEQAD